MPENSGYMVAAYVVTGVIYLGYTAALWWRAKRAVQGERGVEG